MEFIALIVRYFMAVQKHLTPEDVREAIQQAFPENAEDIMTNAVREFFNQGVQHGIQQGVEMGKREGLQQGLEIGRKDSLIEMNLKILHKKFGKLDNASETKIKKLASKQLEDLGLAIFDFVELKDLKNWLKANGK